MPKIKIRCEAIARHSGKPCLCKGYLTPTKKKYLCTYHRGSKSWDHKTRKYKGLYRNDNIDIQKKINILKNLKNFKDKTDDQIKEYIFKERERANSQRYRTKYFTRHYLRWRNSSYRNQRHIKDQLDDFLSVLRQKSKV